MEHPGAVQGIGTSGCVSQHDFEARLVHPETEHPGAIGGIATSGPVSGTDFMLKFATFCMKTEQHLGAIQGIATSGRATQHDCWFNRKRSTQG